jgi:hypothetical protein
MSASPNPPNYPKTQAEYGKIYDRSPKTIGRWQKLGYPLEDFDATQLILAGGGCAPRTGTQEPPPSGTGEKGLSAAIERLRTAELDAAEAYNAAREAGDEILAAQRLKQWLALQKSLRELEQATPEVESQNSRLVNATELRAALGELFSRHRIELENFAKRLPVLLVNRSEGNIRDTLAAEVGLLIDSLYSFSFVIEEEGSASEQG